MKGYYGRISIGWSAIFAFVMFMTFLLFTSGLGYVTFSVTGQPIIDGLNQQLSDCFVELEMKCEPCPECQCGDWLENVGFLLLGMLFGFIYFTFWGEDLKNYLIKKWTGKEVKKKK